MQWRSAYALQNSYATSKLIHVWFRVVGRFEGTFDNLDETHNDLIGNTFGDKTN